jgi:hypothetical protein
MNIGVSVCACFGSAFWRQHTICQDFPWDSGPVVNGRIALSSLGSGPYAHSSVAQGSPITHYRGTFAALGYPLTRACDSVSTDVADSLRGWGSARSVRISITTLPRWLGEPVKRCGECSAPLPGCLIRGVSSKTADSIIGVLTRQQSATNGKSRRRGAASSRRRSTKQSSQTFVRELGNLLVPFEQLLIGEARPVKFESEGLVECRRMRNI